MAGGERAETLSPVWLTRMSTILSNLLAGLGVLGVTVAGITAFAYWLFKVSGERWLAQKFSERLEDHKHAQQKELENLRFQIGSTMDRKLKLHKLEFEVLPKLWEHLNEAFGEVARFASSVQNSPNLDVMNPMELADFLAECPLAEWQKGELREGGDKVGRFRKMIFWFDLTRVNRRFVEFNNYFITNGIFISYELKDKISILRDILIDAMEEKRHEEEHPSPRAGRWKCCVKVGKEGTQLLEEIEGDVRAVLWQVEPV